MIRNAYTMPANSTVLLNRFLLRAKFRHMQVLVTLSELGSMRRTAAAVHMTQPAISQIIAELESLMETELFLRHAKGVIPTGTTLALLPIAQRVLSALEDGAELIARRNLDHGSMVRVSASPAAIGGLLHGRLDGFARARPDILVQISRTDDSAPLSGTAEGAADLICLRAPSTIPEGWRFDPCLTDRLVVLCGRDHPFAGHEDVSGRDLGGAVWLQNRVGSVARQRFETFAETYDWPRSARCQILTHVATLTRDLLMTGRYLAILPRSVALPWLDKGEVQELRTEMTTPLADLGILWRGSEAGPAAASFAKYLRGAMAGSG